MRYKSPSCPFPRWEWTDAAFAFNFLWRVLIASYVGSPTTESTVRKGKLSLIFSVKDVMVVLAWMTDGGIRVVVRNN